MSGDAMDCHGLNQLWKQGSPSFIKIMHIKGPNVQKFGLWILHLSIIFTHPQNFEVLE
jgi:hypothetical protein